MSHNYCFYAALPKFLGVTDDPHRIQLAYLYRLIACSRGTRKLILIDTHLAIMGISIKLSSLCLKFLPEVKILCNKKHEIE